MATYHHGDLRRAIMAAAVQAITESGITTWSLRELARRAGVSHAAPAHHFKDKTGLLTALATEGWTLFADALAPFADDLLEMGVAYVRFAAGHPAHFEVMFNPSLYDQADPDLAAARARAGDILAAGAATLSATSSSDPLAAWSIAHGFAALWLSGSLPPGLDPDPSTAARPVLEVLFRDRAKGPR